MNKILSILISFLYLFTAQLSVHAFTMHSASHGDDEHHHGEEKCDCGDMQPSHDHDVNHGDTDDHHVEAKDTDHGQHDMTMCLEQSLGVVAIDTVDIIDYDCDYTLPTLRCLTVEQDQIDQYFYSINDPGRGEDSSFSKFLNNDLYGHGIIMHC